MSNFFPEAVEKFVKPCLAYVEHVEQSRFFVIQSRYKALAGAKAETSKADGKFILTFWSRLILDYQDRPALLRTREPFVCIGKDLSLVFSFRSFSNISHPFTKDLFRFDCTAVNYHSSEMDSTQKRYYRLLIPAEHEQSPGSFLESHALRINPSVRPHGLIPVIVGSKSFHLFPHSDNELHIHYLVIDSLEPITWRDFAKHAEALLHSYAFVTGTLLRDRRYFFCSSAPDFTQMDGIAFETQKASLTSPYGVIPSSVLRIQFQLPNHAGMSQQQFSSLCSAVFEEPELLRLLLLMVEGHTLSVSTQATVYSVALEAITDLVVLRNPKKLVPIADKRLSKRVVAALQSVVESFSSNLSPQAIDTLSKKLAVINTPTNKQKLLEPFAEMGISLSKSEVDAINRRNDFLHGRIPTISPDVESAYLLKQIAYTLLYCTAALILKYTGYTGDIVYYPALNEVYEKRRFNDPVVKSI